MKKSILNLEGVQELSNKQQKNINGALRTWCRRRSSNVIDIRTGVATTPDPGFLNLNGYWVYGDMSPIASLNCPPGSPVWCV